MPSNSELVCWLCLRCGLLFSGPFTLSEPVGCVSGFDYGAMMCHPVEERGCHLGIAEDGDPFTELQVGDDDDAGFLVEFAYQMEQQRAAGLWERDVTQLINNDAIQWRQLPDDLPGITLGLLPDQGVDQIHSIEEAGLFALIDQCGSQSNGDVGFACASSAHQNEVVGVLGELSGAEGIDPSLSNSGCAVIEGGKILVMRELSNPHLILD